MNDLIIEKTQNTPGVNFNAGSGVLKISGRAYSGDINLLYKKLNAWLDQYIIDPKDSTTIELQLEYYNSIFYKLLFYFLEKAKKVIQKDKKLFIKWNYHKGDEDSIDEAIRISKVIKMPIERIEFE